MYNTFNVYNSYINKKSFVKYGPLVNFSTRGQFYVYYF